ncbi:MULTISPECIES: GNAT family N-acetyltransferase [unclassified Saccharothrix]|uniref:GNAT family N-acetyltransferase n=1 Tax=unclassified Saccharothrix TaxID=2593673 RepID=UPI00307EA16F
MRVLHTPDEVAAANPDPIVRWAAQSLLPGGGGAAWAHGGAVAVHAPALNRHDRLVLAGPTDDIATLLDTLHRPGLEPMVTTETAAALPQYPARGTFGWMERTGTLAAPDGVRWLREDEWDDVESLLRKASPHSYVWPHERGPRRWAGIHVDDCLVAVAAEAWSAPGIGFLAGVATHPDHRGRGLSTRICAYVACALLAEHGECALMVDGANAPAIRVYERLGFTYRSVTALK